MLPMFNKVGLVSHDVSDIRILSISSAGRVKGLGVRLGDNRMHIRMNNAQF